MDVFESVRKGVTAREAAERYGVKVRRNGMARCPFHNDRTPSMKLDKRFHCFGCGADGDAISFAERMFGLKPLDAARKLAEDFGIPYEDDGRKKKKVPARRRALTREERVMRARKELEKWSRHAQKVLLHYRDLLTAFEIVCRPENPGEAWDPVFCEALSNKDRINWYLDILCEGDENERMSFFWKTEGR